MFARVPHVQTARENWVQVFMQVVLLRARCCWRGRVDALDFEIQTVADLASMTPRHRRHLGELMRPFPADLIRMWPISTRVNKPENADPSIVEPIALESPYRTVATASSQSPTTIAVGAAAPLPQNNVNRILPYRRHT